MHSSNLTPTLDTILTGDFALVPLPPRQPLFTIAFVSLRETLEASLLVGIVVTFLHASNALRPKKYAWYGVMTGIIVSIAFFCVLSIMHANLPENLRETYEGWLMILSALLVAWLVISFSFRTVSLKHSIEHSLRTSLETSSVFSVFFLTFSTVAREGAEMAMFLQALLIDTVSHGSAVVALMAGVSAGLCLAYILVRWLAHIRIRLLLRISGVLLVLIAGELFIEGLEKLGAM